MIKVIDGKRYSTETADQVFSYSNGRHLGDFRYRSWNLYLTQNGSWFFHHEGGALSDMAKSVGTSRCSSEDIEPASADDAFNFLQANSNVSKAIQAIEKYFADRVADA